MTRFEAFTLDELNGLASAMESAEGEGAFGTETDRALAKELTEEFAKRELDIPYARGRLSCPADEWLNRVDLA
jgi:hypothetical protein